MTWTRERAGRPEHFTMMSNRFENRGWVWVCLGVFFRPPEPGLNPVPVPAAPPLSSSWASRSVCATPAPTEHKHNIRKNFKRQTSPSVLCHCRNTKTGNTLVQLSALGSSSSIVTRPWRKLLSKSPIGAFPSKQASGLARTSFRDTAKLAMSMGKGRLGRQPVWKRTTFSKKQKKRNKKWLHLGFSFSFNHRNSSATFTRLLATCV